MAPYNGNTSGLNTPESELESLVGVHPTAARRPYPIVVQSESTSYSDEYITSRILLTSIDNSHSRYPGNQTVKVMEL